MRLIENIKTFFLEFNNIKQYVNKKTNERLLTQHINNSKYTVKTDHAASDYARKQYIKYIDSLSNQK